MDKELLNIVNCTEVKLFTSKLTLIKEFNLSIAEFDWVEILGKNNSGKSSLLQVLYGLNQKFKGSVELFNSSVENPKDLQEARRKIGFVSANVNLVPNKTLRANLSLALTAIDADIDLECEAVQDILESLKLKDKLLDNVDGFSESEVIFSKLARALICKPQLLLIDCPFRVLDAASEQMFTTVIYKYWESRKATLILCTDHLSKFAPSNRKIYTIEQQEIKIVLPGI